MKNYEITYIITPDITTEEADALAKETEIFVQGKGGIILRSEKPVAKTLSYAIKKQGSGFFVILEFQIEPEELIELNKKIGKDKKILRHFTVVKNPTKKRKERRERKNPVPTFENGITFAKETPVFSREHAAESTRNPAEGKEKVELREIEKKLDEILGE